MKRTILVLSVSVLHSFNLVIAQQTTDRDISVLNNKDTVMNKHELDEVVIEAQNQRAEAGQLVFIPTLQQKNASQNGYDLLFNLAIPQILVKPEGHVTTLSGGDVAIFINGIKAAEYEIKSLHSADVIRVDYFDFPSDPKFGGAEHVINFILKKIEGGGYTRAYAATTQLNKRTAEVNIFSKYVYRRMTYDLYVGYDYSNSHHTGADTHELYSLINSEGNPYELTKISESKYTRQRSWNIPVSFQAIYSNNNFEAANTVSFYLIKSPANINNGLLTFYPNHNDNDYEFSTSETSDNKCVFWNGYYNFNFNNNYDLSLRGSAFYIRNKSDKIYSTSIIDDPDIITDTKEDVYNIELEITGRKKFNDFHSLSANVWYWSHNNKVTYTGTSNFKNAFYENFVKGYLAYDINLPIGLAGHAEAGANWRHSEVTGKTNCQLSPYANLSISYAPTHQHQLNLYAEYKSVIEEESMKTSEIIQNSEFLYLTGNPLLNSIDVVTMRFLYTWIPSNSFFGTLILEYVNNHNMTVPLYTHYNGGNAILRSYINGDNYRAATVGVKLTYKPIRNLMLQCLAAYQPIKLEYQDTRSIHPIQGMASATYYFGKFYASLTGYSSGRNLNGNAQVIKMPRAYRIAGGWSNGQWNVRLIADNIFNSSWKSTTITLDSPLYSNYSTSLDGLCHRGITISASYTIDYGKRVNRGYEIGAPQSTGSSAVLK